MKSLVLIGVFTWLTGASYLWGRDSQQMAPAPQVGCLSIGPYAMSDVMEHMTEAEAAGLMRALGAMRG